MRFLKFLAVSAIVLPVSVWSLLPPLFGHLPDGVKDGVTGIADASLDASARILPAGAHRALSGWVGGLDDEAGFGTTTGGSRTSSSGRYDRDEYGGWIDEDRNCLDTRAEVLRAMSTGPVKMRSNGCSVGFGKWDDPYTGRVFTVASEVDIDHIVPLAWAHAHGAAEWGSSKKREFANWQPNLIPVEAAANRQKGASAPWDWLPPNESYRCQYIIRFKRIATQWGLQFDTREQEMMNSEAATWCE